MSDIGELFSSVSNVLRDQSLIDLMEENKVLKSKSDDPMFGVKVKILEHTYDLGRARQPESFGCILKLDKQYTICLIRNTDGIHIRPIDYKFIRISNANTDF